MKKKHPSNKEKREEPKVSYQLLARHELDALLKAYNEGALDERKSLARLRQLEKEIGSKMLDLLINRLESDQGELRHAALWAILQISDEASIPDLWKIVKDPQQPIGTRAALISVLESLGEEAIPETIAFDLKEKDLEDLEKLGRESLDFFMTSVQQAKGSDELEQLMVEINSMSSIALEGEGVLLHIIQEMAHNGTAEAADFLSALAETTPSRVVRGAAEKAIKTLRGVGVEPQSKVVESLKEVKFFKAFTSDIEVIPDQQQIVVVWEKEKSKVQAMIFLLDHWEWKGALKDFFMTRNIAKRTLLTNIISKAEKQGIPMKEIPLDHARNIVQKALRITKRSHKPVPEEYDKFQSLIERRLLSEGKKR